MARSPSLLHRISRRARDVSRSIGVSLRTEPATRRTSGDDFVIRTAERSTALATLRLPPSPARCAVQTTLRAAVPTASCPHGTEQRASTFVNADSMNQLSHRSVTSPRSLFLVSAGLALTVGGCGGGGNLARRSVTGYEPGSVQANPSPTAASKQFVVDSNYGGQQTSVQLREVFWGRLVDIVDSTGATQAVDIVIGQALTNNANFELSTNPITDKTTVRIKHLAGTTQYQTAYRVLSDDANLTRVADVGLDPVVTIPFIPRNAALVLKFDDLLDSSTIDGLTVRLRTGNPPETPFLGRVIPDLNHGDLAEFNGQPGLEFYTTRVVVDSTISAFDAEATGLPVNSIGFPGSLSLGQGNLQIRIPTQVNAEANQTRVLSNPTDHEVSTSGSGTVDFASVTQDIARTLRTGGTGEAIGDPNNGFLPDNEAPSILGRQPVVFDSIEPVVGTDLFITDLQFSFTPCALRLRAGDVLQQAVNNCTVFAVVACPPNQQCGPNQAAAGTISNGVLSDVYFRYVRSGAANDACATATFIQNQVAQLGVGYTPALHGGTEPCFLTFSSVGSPPNRNVAPDSTVAVRFSEPIDPASVTAFDTFTLTRYDRGYTDLTGTPGDPIDTNPETLPMVAPLYRNFVVGRISPSPDLREFRFLPTLPFNHAVGVSEAVYLTLRKSEGGGPGIRDLAGNSLSATFDTPDTAASDGIVGFELEANAPAQRTDGFVFRFEGNDMVPGTETAPGAGDPDNDGFGLPEFRGEFLIDGANELLRPRPVTRFQAAADRTQPIPSLMVPFALGVQTPISRYGSKLQTIWRYCDVGFSLLDEQFFNVDVEHLYWAPAGGSVVADTIPRMEISLSTSIRLPDEAVDLNLLPLFPASGLTATFASNVLDAANDPLRTVHPGQFGQPGYVIQPIDAIVTTTGTTVMPWPLNRNITADRRTYYTWRNTAVLAKGAPSGAGADITFALPPGATPTFGVNQVPSIGMPLLMEFRCYPNNAITGANAFDISLAAANSPQPNFRAFSTGGVSTTGIVTREPDLQDVALGGFNPNSQPTPGAGTPPVDNSFYIGATDLVIRVSRAFSTWFDSGSSGVRYQEPVVEPTPSAQPSGTQIQIAFRGANVVTNNNLRWNADTMNMYGEPSTGATPTYFQNNATWRATMADISSPDGLQPGARLFQMRLTFISNAATNLAPTLSALGISWRE